MDIIMWWQNLDISGDKYIGKIDIELPGKGPQIKLEAIWELITTWAQHEWHLTFKKKKDWL